MASLRSLRKRIASTKSTRKITKAMKMIAAVRLRKAAEAISAARPYAVKMHEMLSHLAARIEGGTHPLLDREKEVKKVELLVLTSDRGLCGGFNTNILRKAEAFRRENAGKYEVTISVIGRKGRDYFAVRGISVRKYHVGVFDNLSYVKAQEIADEITGQYLAGAFDHVELVYNEFKSAISQRVVNETLLPVKPLAADLEAVEKNATDYDYEPDKIALLGELLKRYFASQIYRAMLESVASEYGARMTAMDSATNNASDMIDGLTLQYNRARQAAITKELMEIIGGSEALKA
jgi:F-type H+-transporting ATPase subunit gamma